MSHVASLHMICQWVGDGSLLGSLVPRPEQRQKAGPEGHTLGCFSELPAADESRAGRTQVSLLLHVESDMLMHGLGALRGTGSTYWDRAGWTLGVDMQGPLED